MRPQHSLFFCIHTHTHTHTSRARTNEYNTQHKKKESNICTSHWGTAPCSSNTSCPSCVICVAEFGSSTNLIKSTISPFS